MSGLLYRPWKALLCNKSTFVYENIKMLNITKAEKSRTALCSVRELNKGMKERATLGPYVMIYSQFSRPALPISS